MKGLVFHRERSWKIECRFEKIGEIYWLWGLTKKRACEATEVVASQAFYLLIAKPGFIEVVNLKDEAQLVATSMATVSTAKACPIVLFALSNATLKAVSARMLKSSQT